MQQAAEDARDTAVDVELFKAIGLDRMLRPAEAGGHGARTRRAHAALVWLNVVYFAMPSAWLPTAAGDAPRLIYTVMLITYSVTCSVKGLALVRHAARMRAVADAGRAAFTRHGARSPGKVRRCRAIVRRLMRAFVAAVAVTAVAWAAAAALTDEYVPVTRLDGTVSRYRATVLSVWFPLPEPVHNSRAGWTALYTVELFFFAAGLASMIMFDVFVITMCFVLDAQFRTVADGFETLGRRGRGRLPSTEAGGGGGGGNAESGGGGDTASENVYIKPSESEQSDHYNDLIDHVQDCQKVMNAFNEFYDVIQPFIKFQMAIGSFSIILFMFFVCLELISDQPTRSAFLFKYVSALFTVGLQIFTYCYMFHIVETAKSTLNFGLYSCHWTEMDLKFQKTMLLAMQIHSAYNNTMNITPKFVINLELFLKVVQKAYSVIPVLLRLSS